jgi:hypothetical protein
VTLSTLLRALVIALALCPISTLGVRADDGDTRSPEPIPFPITHLRPSDITTAPVPTLHPDLPPSQPRSGAARRELVIFVGGYGSTADDGAFVALSARFPSDRYEVRRLGDDPRYPYDTYGNVDWSARILTQEIRELGPQYAGVNIVSHSMGGVVVDRAFVDGLSASDGVRTHVSIAGPHNGADFARVPTVVLPLIAPVKDIIRGVALLGARDPESPAARDLATATPVPAPKGVARVDVNLASDGFVNRFDGHNPGVERRLFLPGSVRELVDGHGGSLVNAEIADLIVETVREHRVAPDRRDPLTRVVAPILWDHETSWWRTVLFIATLGAVGLYAARFLPFCGPTLDRMNEICRRLLRSIGR